MRFFIFCAMTLTSYIAAESIWAAAPSDRALARAEITAYYIGKEQPFIEAAEWTSSTLFNVGVHYMGSRQDYLAAEVCGELKDRHLASRTRVRVIDINTMGEDKKRWEVVGEARC